jgi:hypothetical protein
MDRGPEVRSIVYRYYGCGSELSESEVYRMTDTKSVDHQLHYRRKVVVTGVRTRASGSNFCKTGFLYETLGLRLHCPLFLLFFFSRLMEYLSRYSFATFCKRC